MRKKFFVLFTVTLLFGCGVEFNEKNQIQPAENILKPKKQKVDNKNVEIESEAEILTIFDKNFVLDENVEIEADIVNIYSEKITTIQNSLKIKAKKIVFLDTFLETFPNQKNTSNKIHGLSGGEITIEADEVEGALHVSLRGQNGRNGIEPNPLGEKGRGKPGKNGSPGFHFCQKHAPDGPICSCEGSVEPGRGGKGKRGKVGSPGGNGGGTGSINLLFKDTSNFEFSYDLYPGNPGRGSIGGKGGPGGFGGRVETSHMCGGGSKGRDGSSGDRGPRGKDGKPGKEGVVCVKFNKFSAMECGS